MNFNEQIYSLLQKYKMGYLLLIFFSKPFLSKMVGNYFFKTKLSTRFIPQFIKKYEIDLSDFESKKISEYKSLNDFFIRKLKPNIRKIEGSENDFISPTDSSYTFIPNLAKKEALFIKNHNFTINSFIPDALFQTYLESNVSAIIFRLRPQDYHRFHMPITAKIDYTLDIPGKLLSVSPTAFNEKDNPLAQNFRKIFFCETRKGIRFAIVAVGAMFIGSIIQTAPINVFINKGDELGYFEFGGSTIVLVFKQETFKPDTSLITKLNLETEIKMGKEIGSSKAASN